MRRSLIVSGMLLALACALFLAGTASAGTLRAEAVSEPISFKLRGTHGYTIVGSAYIRERSGPGEGPGPGMIDLTVSRAHEAVGYSSPAQVTADSIRANLGSLGRVDLTLHRSGRKKTVYMKCLRQRLTFEVAAYEGVVDFNGEGGYTRARATRVPAVPAIDLFPASVCDSRSSAESRGSGLPGARLAGVSFADGRALKFQFNKNRPGGKVLFTASLRERRAGIEIDREVSGVAPASAFRFDPRLRTATLSPPAPFSGSATLQREENSVSPLMTGDLTLAFPGRSVALDGPAVHVSLVHARFKRSGDASHITIGI